MNNRSTKTTTPPNNISDSKLYSAVVDTSITAFGNNTREEPSPIAMTITEPLYSQAATSTPNVKMRPPLTLSQIVTMNEALHDASCSTSSETQTVLLSAVDTLSNEHTGLKTSSFDEKEMCPMCKESVYNKASDEFQGINCGKCRMWFHQSCLHMPEAEYRKFLKSDDKQWFCAWCQSVKANNIKWGVYEGEEKIREIINATYSSMGWKKNLFPLPRGKCGTDFIKKLTDLINLFVYKSKWERVALSLIHIFIPLMTQKPSAKSKPRNHARYLATRLAKWEKGEITSLMNECNEIQKRMKRNNKRKDESKYSYFIKLMMFGKIGDAAKKINNEDSIKGVHTLSDEIREILQEKHPKAREVDPDIIIQQENISPETVIYEEINADLVYKIAREMKGSGGPTLVDADMWKNFLCSKIYGKASTGLYQAVSDMAKILCVGMSY